MIVDYVYNQLNLLPTHHQYLIAYSGGVDSHVLLHIMATLRNQYPEMQLQALHIHHGLSKNADKWAEHCQIVCSSLQIAYQCHYISHSPLANESIEAWAREARYGIFADLLASGMSLLTAHNQDDQAETLFLQLFRGAGPKGLAAMLAQQSFAQGYICRPLLNFNRQQIHEYAMAHQLTWQEDESNEDVRFDRNFLRQQIMPLLRERWPAVVKNLTRSSQHCAEATVLLTELAQQDLGHGVTSEKKSLPLAALWSLSAERQRNALRHWLSSQGCRMPSSQKLQEMQQILLHCRQDALPQVTCDEYTVRRYRRHLVVVSAPLSPPSAPYAICWDFSVPLDLPGNLEQLIAVQQQGTGISTRWSVEKFSIRFRRGGERCQPQGKNHRYLLKKLFQEWGIPPWERNRIPLLYYEEQLAAVVGYCICSPFVAKQDELGWVITRKKISNLTL